MSKPRLIANVLIGVAFYAVPLFVPAQTVNWWRAWVIVGGMAAASAGILIALSRMHSGIIEERSRGPFVPGQPLWDRIVITVALASFVGNFVFTSLDVFRLHLLPKPGVFVSSLGLALAVAGTWIAYLALRENAFAAAVVRHQEERRQTVVDTGVYGIVRHPMYAGGVILMIGSQLWLESYAGAAMASVPAASVVLRLLLEERFLQRQLPGYKAYTRKVRYRLIPYVW